MTFTLIAGPCTVESREQTLTTGRCVAAGGATMLRGGAFKPRASPHSFQGLGRAALAILAEARAETGLPVVTELTDVRELDAVLDVADVIQVGARNMQNAALLTEIGRSGRPVLIKRGPAATLDELLHAADYVLAEGNTDLPVIVDPSHAAGRRELVRPLSLAAVAAGADGLIVEVHADPAVALCDGPQALTTAEFADYAAEALAIARAVRPVQLAAA